MGENSPNLVTLYNMYIYVAVHKYPNQQKYSAIMMPNDSFYWIWRLLSGNS
jgi:hypothetical protein